jgi:hypothetical protein
MPIMDKDEGSLSLQNYKTLHSHSVWQRKTLLLAH